MTDTEITFGNIVNADLIFQFSGIIFVAGHSDGNNISIARIMQKCVCIMNGTIYGIRIDISEIGLILCGFVCYFAIRVKLNELILIALILNQNRIIDQILVLQKELCIGTISADTTIFRIVVIKRLVYFCI